MKDSLETYYALPFDMNEENSPSVFFQLRKALPDFWVLSRKAPEQKMTFYHPSGGGPGGATGGSSYTMIVRPEMVFFLTNDGKITLYHSSAEITGKQSLLSGKRKSVEANMALLQRLTEPHYAKLLAYADDAGLSFDKTADLLKILEYYRTLVGS